MLRLINPRLDWDKRIHEVIGNAKKFRSLTVLSGFNVVTDYIVQVKPEKITAAWKALSEEERKKVLSKSGDGVRHVSNHVDFLASLVYGLRSGKAAHLVASPEALKWVHDWNGEPDERRLGGQPALMAAQLQDLGANNIIYPAWLSVGQAELLPESLRIPVVENARKASSASRRPENALRFQGKKMKLVKPMKAVRAEDPTSVSWIFEFRQGDAIDLGEHIVCPRSNRIIIAYPSAYVPAFRKEFEPFLGKLSKETDVLFLSGLHVLNSKNYKKTTDDLSKQLTNMRNSNHKLRIHYEYVPADDASVEKNLLTSLGKNIDSLGLNEVELGMVLSNLGFKAEEKELLKSECAETLYYGALAIMRKLKLRRVHVHSLGYNILVLPKTENAEKARNGALFGSVVASIKSQEGELNAQVLKKEWKLRISEAGYNQIGVFESTIWDAFQKRKRKPISALLRKTFMSSGIFEEKDHFAIIVPAPIASGVKTTVGLGDVVSACAYAYENLK